MDTLRGNFGLSGYDGDDYDYDAVEDEIDREPPPSIGTDERRMQVRAYNHWAGLLDERNFPSIEDLEPETLDDFGPYSVLLDFTSGIEDPAVHFLGKELAGECGTNVAIEHLSDVPSRSLLSRITDHYMQILANQAPIGFEAEFVNQRGATILYRGILLPYSSDGETIDFIYGVINWKEMADQQTTDELLLQIDQALETDDDALPEPEAGDRDADEVTDWADGPSADISTSVTYDDGSAKGADETDPDKNDILDLAGMAVEGQDKQEGEFPVPAFGDEVVAPDASEAEEYIHDEKLEDEEKGDEAADDAEDPVVSRLSSLIQPRAPAKFDDGGEDFDDHDDFDDEEDGPLVSPLASLAGLRPSSLESDGSPLLKKKKAMALPEPDGESVPESLEEPPVPAKTGAPAEEADIPTAFEPEEPAHIDPRPEPAKIAEAADEELEQDRVSEVTPQVDDVPGEEYDAGLHDCLAEARELAQEASASENRSRAALYSAVSRAYDVAVAAEQAPDEFAELVEENGLTMQERAPMTPVVKLVFGAGYDKTRLTEYAAVLSHAQRVGIERGGLSEFLSRAEGGLKGVVQAERRIRKEESGKAVEEINAVRESLAKKLRELDAMLLEAINREGPEFSLALIHRGEEGDIRVLGEISDDIPLVEKVARKLLN